MNDTREHFIFRNKEQKQMLELIIKIYNLTSSFYIREMIIADLQKTYSKKLTAKDLLHGFNIEIKPEKIDQDPICGC